MEKIDCGQVCSVRLSDYSAARAEALLCGADADAIPVTLRITPGGCEQQFSLAGLWAFAEAFAEGDAVQRLGRMKSLCETATAHPIWTQAQIGVLAHDRLFWEPEERCWRGLLLIDGSEAWQGLPAYTDDEIWSALFVAAMDASVQSQEVLQAVVDRMQGIEFSLPALMQAIDAEILLREQEAELELSEPPELPEQPEPDEQPEPIEEAPEEDDEYRPWEAAQQEQKPLDKTGATLERGGTMAEEKPPVIEGPAQPVIPGIAPPPPPPSRGCVEPSRAAEVETTRTTVLIKPETCVLDNFQPGGVAPTSAMVRVVRVETNESAPLDRPYYVIGSKAGSVDFLVRDNRVVSRRHAAVVTKGSEYYLVDLGSKNGVFLNGERLPRETETPLRIGDVFILANDKFTLQR